MPASKTKKSIVIERRQRVARLYLQGKSMSYIADVEGVGNATITRDLQALHKQWIEAAQLDTDSLISKQLARYDAIILNMWEQYELNQSDTNDGTKYIKIILDAMKQQEKILGLHAPKKIDLNGTEVVVTFTNDWRGS